MGGMQGHGNMGSPTMGGSMAPGMPGIPGGMPGIPSSTGQGMSSSLPHLAREEDNRHAEHDHRTAVRPLGSLLGQPCLRARTCWPAFHPDEQALWTSFDMCRLLCSIPDGGRPGGPASHEGARTEEGVRGQAAALAALPAALRQVPGARGAVHLRGLLHDGQGAVAPHSDLRGPPLPVPQVSGWLQPCYLRAYPDVSCELH